MITSLISCATVSTVDFDVDIVEIRDLGQNKYISLNEKPLREIKPYEQIEVVFQTKLNLLNLAKEKYNILCEYNNSKKDIGFIFLEGSKQDKNLPLETLVRYSFDSNMNKSNALITYACNLPKSSISQSSGFSFNVDARKYFPYDIYRSRTVKLSKEVANKLYKQASN